VVLARPSLWDFESTRAQALTVAAIARAKKKFTTRRQQNYRQCGGDVDEEKEKKDEGGRMKGE
jgi:hypothetical protein